ncbi:hypothetical protein NKH48_07105, partial [Mesorhizobium sp. M1233]
PPPPPSGGRSSAPAGGPRRPPDAGRIYRAPPTRAAGPAPPAAILVFIVFSWWSSRNMATPLADQATALFGNFAIGSAGYLGVAVMVLVIGALTAATSHFTVVTYLSDIDIRQPDAG